MNRNERMATVKYGLEEDQESMDLSKYDSEWQGGRSLEQVYKEVEDLIRFRKLTPQEYPEVFQVKNILSKAIQNQGQMNEDANQSQMFKWKKLDQFLAQTFGINPEDPSIAPIIDKLVQTISMMSSAGE